MGDRIMKILGIVGSNREKGNSYLLLNEMFRNLPEIEVIEKAKEVMGLLVREIEKKR